MEQQPYAKKTDDPSPPKKRKDGEDMNTKEIKEKGQKIDPGWKTPTTKVSPNCQKFPPSTAWFHNIDLL